jgi:copper(I)-binding protein
MAACGSKAPAGPKVEVEDVWSRPGMMGQQSGAGSHNMAGTGAVFMTLKNEGREADRLLSAQTDVAQAVEIHETVLEEDVAKMQQVSGGIEVPAQGQVELKPGGYHVMLIGLLRDLAVGDRFTVTLDFEKSDDLTVEAEVRQP